MSAPTVDLLDKLGAAALECRELLAEVRGATKDMRAAIRDGEAAQLRLKDDFAAWLQAEWEQAEAIDMLATIKKSWSDWQQRLDEALEAIENIHKINAKITRRAIVLGA